MGKQRSQQFMLRLVGDVATAMAGAGYVEHDAATERFTLPDQQSLVLSASPGDLAVRGRRTDLTPRKAPGPPA